MQLKRVDSSTLWALLAAFTATAGSKLRLRPILMTSSAFILEYVPLMLPSGSGAAARRRMGTGVGFGMTIATAVGLSINPVCCVSGQRLSERVGKQPEAVPSTEAQPAL